MVKDVIPAPTAPSKAAQAQQGKKLISRLSARFNVDNDKFMDTLKATAFKLRPDKKTGAVQVVTDEQMMMLLVVAEQYHLNPFTREIYAFPQDGGIVPIIPIDGWIRIINEHPQLDSIEIELAPEGTAPENAWCQVSIKRKDRAAPVTIREYLAECRRNTDPWNEFPKRMLRHKAIIQCARIAFGFAGVFDPDEAERVFAAAIDVTPRQQKPATATPKAIEAPATQKAIEATAPLRADLHIKIMDRLKVSEVPASLVCAHFEIADITQLHEDQFASAMAFIDAEFANAG